MKKNKKGIIENMSSELAQSLSTAKTYEHKQEIMSRHLSLAILAGSIDSQVQKEAVEYLKREG